MSFSVTVLEPKDRVQEEDYFRPLSFTSGMDDTVHTFSCYGGRPDNHCRWVRVFDVLGKCYLGKTVSKINRTLRREYEFIRGPVPAQLQWNWKKEKS